MNGTLFSRKDKMCSVVDRFPLFLFQRMKNWDNTIRLFRLHFSRRKPCSLYKSIASSFSDTYSTVDLTKLFAWNPFLF